MVWELNGSGNNFNNPAKNKLGGFQCTIALENIIGRNGVLPVFGVQSVEWSKYLVNSM